MVTDSFWLSVRVIAPVGVVDIEYGIVTVTGVVGAP